MMEDDKGKDMAPAKRFSVAASMVLFGLVLIATWQVAAATITVDCSTGGVVGPTLSSLKPGDVLSVQGTCRENILLPVDLHDITVDGGGKATIAATDARQPAVQVLGREITLKGLTV